MNESWIDNFRTDPSTGAVDATLTCRNLNNYLADHFRGYTVVPGVILLEGFRQALSRNWEHETRPWTVVAYENFRFLRFVRPDQVVHLNLKPDLATGQVQCRGEVDGECVVRGRILIKPVFDPGSSPYLNGNCEQFENWGWFHELWTEHRNPVYRANLTAPHHADYDGHGLIPEPFIFEGLAQFASRVLRREFSQPGIIALAKIPSLIVLNSVDYMNSVTLELSASDLSHQGGRFTGRAYAGDLLLMETEFMLAYSQQQEISVEDQRAEKSFEAPMASNHSH